jgi:RNA polymerase sigma-70 factor (ECF subfamily)
VKVRTIVDREVGRPTDAAFFDVSFDDFFATQYRPLVTLATSLCGSRAVGEDVVQEALFAASRAWSRVSQYDNPAQWIRGVVARRASNVRRGRLREARAIRRLAGTIGRSYETLPEIVDDEFWKAVWRLPRRQRQCVTLRYLDERSTTEIASALGIAEPTVRVHLHVAMGALASALEGRQEP